MTIIATTAAFAGVDVDEVCRNWRTASDAIEYAMGNRWVAIQMLSNALNYAAARQIRRVQFQMYTHPDYSNPVTSDPMYQWYFDDLVDDGRTVVYRIISAIRESSAGDSYAGREGTETVDRTSNLAQLHSFTYPQHLVEMSFEYDRGAAAASEITEGITTVNGYNIIDIVVTDKPLVALDTGTHVNYIDIGNGKPGDEILANHVEALRARFHQLRITNLPILSSWCATAASGTFAATAANPALGECFGNQFGVKCYTSSSSSKINVIDCASTTRTATSPGIPCFVKVTGIGRNTIAKGYKLKVQCRVLADKIAEEGGAGAQVPTVTFEGPLDSITINITNPSSPQWYGTSSSFINLDTSQDDDETSATGNKVDIFAAGDRDLVDEVYEGASCRVYGWMMWVDYNSYW